MKQSKFPEGWGDERVRKALSHHEEQTEEEAVAEDQAGVQSSETVMSVPHELVPVIREMIAKRRSSAVDTGPSDRGPADSPHATLCADFLYPEFGPASSRRPAHIGALGVIRQFDVAELPK